MKRLLILFLFQVLFCQLNAQIKAVEIIDKKINYQEFNDSLEMAFYSKPAYLIVSVFEDNIAKILSKPEVDIFIDGIKLKLIDTSKYLIIPKIDTSKN